MSRLLNSCKLFRCPQLAGMLNFSIPANWGHLNNLQFLTHRWKPCQANDEALIPILTHRWEPCQAEPHSLTFINIRT